jgi:hypothetical protein
LAEVLLWAAVVKGKAAKRDPFSGVVIREEHKKTSRHDQLNTIGEMRIISWQNQKKNSDNTVRLFLLFKTEAWATN